MPSSMVHLSTAYSYDPNSPVEFWVGNLAPDCIDDWKERDKYHFRNEADKEQAFNDFAATIDINDSFFEGILLHMFVDWKWGEDLKQQYINCFTSGDSWFQPYREEIGFLSARLYHDTFWSDKVWNEMINSDIHKFNKTSNIHSEEFMKYLKQAKKYHVENPLVEPRFYTVESVTAFIDKTAEDYQQRKNTYCS